MNNGWQTATLGDALQRTETINPLQAPEADFDYIDVSSVSNSTFRIEDTQRIKGRDAPSRARRLVRANDVLFATVRPTLQRIAIVPEHLDNQICSTGYLVLRPKAGIDHRFVFYSLFTEDFMGQMERLQKGASYPAVTDGEVRRQLISFPPLPEQQRIVGILDGAFERIAAAQANAERNLHNARAIFESHLQAIFGHRPDSWKTKALSDTCPVFADGDWVESKDQSPEGIRLIQTGNVGRGMFKERTEKARYVSEATFKRLRCTEIFEGDCLISRLPDPVGRSCMLPDTGERMITAVDCTIVRFDATMIIPQFFVYYSQSEDYSRAVNAETTGTTRDRISRSKLAQVQIPVPPLVEQQRIIARLDLLSTETRRLAKIYERKLDGLEALKTSVLHEAFTGNL